MRFTRRRWDLWCAAGAGLFAAGGTVAVLLTEDSPLRIPAYAAAIIPLVLLRFWIPSEGKDYPEIRAQSREAKILIAWCVVSPPGFLVAVALASNSSDGWWVWAAAAGAVLLITLCLAYRADRARKKERSTAGS